MGIGRRLAVLGLSMTLVAAVIIFGVTSADAQEVPPPMEWVGGYVNPMGEGFTSIDSVFRANDCDRNPRTGDSPHPPSNSAHPDFDFNHPDAYLPGRYHLAIDMNRGGPGDDEGDLVRAIADGTLLTEGPGFVSGQYGAGGEIYYIEHEAGDGSSFIASYGHIDKNLDEDRDPNREGHQVNAGDRIGDIADSNPATDHPSHLHFAIQSVSTGSLSSVLSCSAWTEAGGPDYGYVDPVPFLEAHPAAPEPEPDPEDEISAVLILDSSGSMTSNDPPVPANDGGTRGLRLQAAVRYVTNTLPGDEVALVEFDSSARTLSGPVDVAEFGSQARSDLNDLIKSINSSGNTDLEDGLQAGCDALGLATKAKRAAIFFTDGDGTYTGEATQCYVDAGWSVFTIGLGSGVVTERLQLIADETGGSYRALTVEDLDVCAILALRAEIAGGGAADPCEEDGVIEQDEVISFSQPVGSNLSQVSFINTWPGSDIEMTATSPSGRTFDRSTVADDLLVDVGPTFEVLTISDPEGGDWDIQLVGTDIPEGSEPYSFTPVEIPGEPDPTGPALIGGTITNTEDGSGLDGVALDLYSQDLNGERDAYLSSTSTAADGSYSFEVQAGCYVVTAIAPPNGVFPQGGTFLNLETCVAADEVDESLNASVTIVVEGTSAIGGTIRFADGSGAADVVVDRFVAADEWNRAEYVGSSRTAADGSYSFDGVEAGCYIVVMIAPKGAEFEGGVDGDELRNRWRQVYGCVAADQQNLALDGSLVAEPTDLFSSIGGQVTNEAGAPEPEIVADLFTAGGVGDRAQWIESGKTDVDGNFLFTGRLADCYIVVLRAPQGRTFVDTGTPWSEQFSCVGPGETDTSLSATLSG